MRAMVNWSIYESRLYGNNSGSQSESIIESQKQFLLRELVENQGYQAGAKRNGVSQPIVITQTKSGSVCKISALPDDELNIGDIIECLSGYWLVVDVNPVNPIAKSGEMWLCNLKIRFQNKSSTVVERYCVVDSGSYSKTSTNQVIDTVSAGYKIYLPNDEETKKIPVDKRLTTGRIYNSNGEQILEVYEVEWIDSKSKNNGLSDGIIILNVRAGEYNKITDNLSLLVCDYIEPDEPEEPEPIDNSDDSEPPLGESGNGEPEEEYPEIVGKYTLSGRANLRIGTSAKYTIGLLNNDNTPIEITSQTDYIVSFDGEAASIGDDTELSNNTFILNCPMDYSLIGKSLTIKIHSVSGIHTDAELSVGVVNIG